MRRLDRDLARCDREIGKYLERLPLAAPDGVEKVRGLLRELGYGTAGMPEMPVVALSAALPDAP